MNIYVRSLLLPISILLALLDTSRAADYYVAPQGNDSQAGTVAAPFGSIARAQEAAQPGDTVYFRGGLYQIREEQIARKQGIFAYVFEMNKSGRAGAPIKYWAYQEEKPVIDFSQVKAEGLRIIAFNVMGSWLDFRGLEVIGVQVTMKTHTQSECFENHGSDNIYERLSMHDGQAIGWYLVSGSNNLVLNCDAYRNYDYTSEDGSGGNVDGFGCHPRKGSTGNVLRGCRAWLNSDDGYDCITACEAVTFDHCWAFYNGFSGDFISRGDGNGFKAGGWARTPTERLPQPFPRHIVRFCLAVRNKANGFYANHSLQGGDWFNNTAFRNGGNFNMVERVNDPDGIHFDINVPGAGQKMKNNLGYKGRSEVTSLNRAQSDISYNYFTLDVQVTDKDFVSLDESQLTRPRQADGSLPEMTFMHLADGSKLIDAGVDIGFPFHGKAPDLGCFER